MSTETTTTQARIRDVLRLHAHLTKDVDALDSSDDLYAAGMTSHASVTVMLACEDEWDVEFPQRMLTRTTFSSVDAIAAALAELGATS
ncbi:acyl carrier protein [Nocardioides rubriscoriae]|uniref:acyl carrier protein n=1 Tax=Nocardioides rubriscoriae TaxID=642762 RepID=UPI0011E024AD|nr:acyl carrier protein [Nocardioides rubriscoriae]